MKMLYFLLAPALAALIFTLPAPAQDFGGTISAAMDAFREARAQNAAPEKVKAIFSKASEAEEEGGINFCGFFLGMTADDTKTLVAYYGLKREEWDAWIVPSNTLVYKFRFSLKGVRRIAKGGNSFDDLAQAVANRIGTMRPKHNDNYDLVGYEYKNIDSQTAFMSESGGLVYEDAKLSHMAVAERAEAVRKAAVERAESDRKAALEKGQQALLNLAKDMVPIPNKNYCICKYEVTQALWQAVLGTNPSKHIGADLPVDNVLYDDCQVFLSKLNSLPQVRDSGLVYRLPSEDEWEYACLAGAVGDICKLSDGTEIDQYHLSEIAWCQLYNSYECWWKMPTHPVGQKKPNAFGLYDMLGNVDEMTTTRASDVNNGEGFVFRGGDSGDGYEGKLSAKTKVVIGTETIRDKKAFAGFRLAADKIAN